MKSIIFFILSPYRAKDYDFKNFIIPTDIELLIISDAVTIKKYFSCDYQTKIVPMVNYPEQEFPFLDLSAIEKIIEDTIKDGYSNIKLISEEELFLDVIGYLNDKYKLDGLGVAGIKKFRNKFLMKNALTPFPKHFIVPKYTNKVLQAANFSFPVIFKPEALAGSLGVTKINTMNELLEHIKINKFGGYIIEEFITGDLYHSDALVYKGRIIFSICGKYFSPLEHATKNFGHIGSEIVNDPKMFSKLLNATNETIQLLNITNSMVHIEFICHNDKLYFIEIGKRPAGGWGSKLYSMAYGINIFNCHLYSSYLALPTIPHGAPPPHKSKYCCGIYLLRMDNRPIKNISIPKVKCDIIYNPFTLNWNSSKSNSVLDAVAEIYFFSDNENCYQESLDIFFNNYKLITS